MADKRVKQARMMITGIFGPEFLLLAPTSAAERIGVNEKYVFDLVNKGHLERLVITDTKGREIGRGITIDSVDAYLKRERKRRQRELPLPIVDKA